MLTGTSLGDPIEMGAMAAVFGQQAQRAANAAAQCIARIALSVGKSKASARGSQLNILAVAKANIGRGQHLATWGTELNQTFPAPRHFATWGQSSIELSQSQSTLFDVCMRNV